MSSYQQQADDWMYQWSLATTDSTKEQLLLDLHDKDLAVTECLVDEIERLRAIVAAGSNPWTKLWVTLRATRVTELKTQWPEHVVNAWMGHTQGVPVESYGIVTEDDFKRAANRNERKEMLK